MKDYVYLVTDIEADGPVPGLHSMISLASIACDEDGEILGEFSENLLPIDGASPHPETMKFWATKPDVWEQCTTGAKAPHEVIKRYAEWVQGFGKDHIFVAQPASFDFMWVNWYLWKFVGSQVISAYTLDLVSLVHGVSGWDFELCRRQEWPKEWLGGHAHTHRALDDVKGYATALREIKKRQMELRNTSRRTL